MRRRSLPSMSSSWEIGWVTMNPGRSLSVPSLPYCTPGICAVGETHCAASTGDATRASAMDSKGAVRAKLIAEREATIDDLLPGPPALLEDDEVRWCSRGSLARA